MVPGLQAPVRRLQISKSKMGNTLVTEIQLSLKTFFLEHQWRHGGEKNQEQLNSRLIHVLLTAMASSFLDCQTELIA